MTASLGVVLVLAVIFDYINGFHDTANAIATSVATRALRPQHAILMAAAFNFIGAFAGTAVAKTIGAGLVQSSINGSQHHISIPKTASEKYTHTTAKEPETTTRYSGSISYIRDGVQ